MKFIFTLALWFGLTGSVLAQAEVDAGQLARNAERVRITAERQQIESAFKAEQAICFRKFFANACRDELLPPYRSALADLRRQEVLMNEVERKISAADQLLKNEERLSLQREKQAEQAIKVQQDADNLTERAKQQKINQGNAAEQAAGNIADRDAKLDSRQSQAAEAETKRAQAAANVEATRQRQAQAAQRRAEHEQRLRDQGPPTGKSLPTYP
jgi:colicin import membrane protein